MSLKFSLSQVLENVLFEADATLGSFAKKQEYNQDVIEELVDNFAIGKRAPDSEPDEHHAIDDGCEWCQRHCGSDLPL